MYRLFVVALIMAAALPSWSQGVIVSGEVIDLAYSAPVPGAKVTLIGLPDTSRKVVTSTDDSGKFTFNQITGGKYILEITSMGLETRKKVILVEDKPLTLGKIYMREAEKTLKDVEVTATQKRLDVKNDTIEYNANAFKANPDATAEDLVKKMPGITVQGNTVKSHGEEIRRVTVDGRTFFGDDASATLKNLPADAVDRVQIFDGLSDQSAFHTFDDGSSQKQMNIVTRAGINKSVFGRLYAGAGYIDALRYNAGATINWFDGNRRLTFLTMHNNVNEQNFSMQDLIGIGGGLSSFGGGAMFRSGGRGGRQNLQGSGFMVGNADGINTTRAAGINYTDIAGKKKNLRLTASYFFHNSSNETYREVARRFFNRGDSSIHYSEIAESGALNFNHRFNLRLEYFIDTLNSITFSPRFNIQDNRPFSDFTTENRLAGGDLLSGNINHQDARHFAYNGTADLLYSHRFKTQWRTLSLGLTFHANNRLSDTKLLSRQITDGPANGNPIDQTGDLLNQNYSATANFSFTEPIGSNGIILFTYNPTYNFGESDKKTFNYNIVTGAYDDPEIPLTNHFFNDYHVQRGGFNYKYREGKVIVTFGGNGEYAWLRGKQYYPQSFQLQKSFLNFLPTASFQYKISATSSFRLNYRTFTAPPTVQQLQNVIDNSNPLSLTTGNPDLKQNYTHSVFLRFNVANTQKSKMFYVFSSFSLTQNHITNTIIIAKNDTMINGIRLPRGAQLSIPININGQMNAFTHSTYSVPFKKIKSNMSITGGLNFYRNPSLINEVKNLSYNISPNAGITLSSNISEKLDFTLSYNASYTLVRNTIQKVSDNDYFNHTASFRFNWLFWKGFVFNTNVSNQLYTGLSEGFNQNIVLLHAALGYKFLKDKSLDFRISVNDILNQNRAVNRSVTETYVEDTRTVILQRYYLVTLTYNLKHKLGSKTPAQP
ncbi:MAG: TonB-dependent receptor [Chitinophagales bacterium]|nr:TonB-dependent receptor [Chitinophagales bacterium]